MEQEKDHEEELLPFDLDVILGLGIEQESSPLDRELDAIFQSKSKMWCCQECDPDSVQGGCRLCQEFNKDA